MANGFTNDPHSERGFACPRNLFGYTDYRQLALVETAFAERKLLRLEDLGVTGKFDSAHLRAIHRYIFQDVFPWAGEFRVVNISKGTSMFRPAQHIARALTETLDKLKLESFLANLDAKQFSARAAFYLGEINAIHPFREGNGRTQREFIRQLALHAGHPLSWAGFTQQQMVDASIASHTRGDNAGLATLLNSALYSMRANSPA